MEALLQTSIILLLKLTYKKPFRRLWKRSSSVVFLTPTLCIKSSPFTTLAEAHAMEFIRNNTNVPVPKVYMAFERKGQVYILMERIQGNMLANGWVFRSPSSKEKILRDLKGMVEEWRSIAPPKGVDGIRNVDGGPIFDERLPTKSSWGPFNSVHEFHSRLRNDIDLEHLSESSPADLQKLIEFHKQVSDTTVLTHGDLSSLNIMCRGDDVVGIVDWETAGWLPNYWEYVTAWNVNPHNEFWQKEVDSFITPWAEALEMDIIRRKYFGDF